MSEDKIEILRRAFEAIDSEDRGEVSIERLKRIYDAGKHPYVTSHKKTRDEVFLEFLESFEEFYQYFVGYSQGGFITLDDFIEYHTSLSMCVDDDDFFIEIIKNVWRLKELEKKRPAKRTYNEEPKNPSVRESPEPYIMPKPKRGAVNIASIDNTLQLSSRLHNQYKQTKKENKINIDDVLDSIRRKFSSRNLKTILSMIQDFKIADKNTERIIHPRSFSNILDRYRLDLSESAIEALVKEFTQQDNKVAYGDFLDALIPQLDERHYKLIESTFNALNPHRSKTIPMSYMAKCYNPNGHPDVKLGKISKNEAFDNFLETFTMCNGESEEITINDFNDYYTYLNFVTKNAKKFDDLLTKVWNYPSAEYQPSRGPHEVYKERKYKGSPLESSPHDYEQESEYSRKNEKYKHDEENKSNYSRSSNYNKEERMSEYSQHKSKHSRQPDYDQYEDRKSKYSEHKSRSIRDKSDERLSEYSQSHGYHKDEKRSEYSEHRSKYSQPQEYHEHKSRSRYEQPEDKYSEHRSRRGQQSECGSECECKPVKEKSSIDFTLINSIRKCLAARGLRGVFGLYRGFRVLYKLRVGSR